MPREEWRSVPGFPRYRVSDFGRLRSERWYSHVRGPNGGVVRVPHGGGPVTGTVQRSRTGRIVRVNVALRDADGRVRRKNLGAVVLLAFVGPCPAGQECCHGDGSPLNNRLGNVRWDSRRGNFADMVRHGTRARGSRVNGAKLTEADVLSIRGARAAGESFAEIARRFGIHEHHAGYVCRGDMWKHVAGPLTARRSPSRGVSPEPIP